MIRPVLNRFRIINGLIGATALVATELGREYYRPFIYSRGIRDYGIADTIGNSLGTITAVFVVLCVSGKNSSTDYRLIAILTLGLCVYELLQGPMGGRIDPNDIFATLISGAICAFLYRLLYGHPLRLSGDTDRRSQ